MIHAHFIAALAAFFLAVLIAHMAVRLFERFILYRKKRPKSNGTLKPFLVIFLIVAILFELSIPVNDWFPSIGDDTLPMFIHGVSVRGLLWALVAIIATIMVVGGKNENSKLRKFGE